MTTAPSPSLVRATFGGVPLWVDPGAPGALGVTVAFSDRTGGVSRPPYHWLNLARRVGDRDDDVLENRRRLAAAVGFDLAALALARQVHGTGVLEVGAGRSGVVGEADVLATGGAGTVVGMLTADCAAVVVAGEAGLAVVHAGWRGLAAGVVEAGVAAVGAARAAWVGPAIRACCYQVGAEVSAAFRSRGLPVAGRHRVDVAEAARVALRTAGVAHVAGVEECTCCEARYFSYRRDGVTGRQGAFAFSVGGGERAAPDHAAVAGVGE